LSSLRRLARGSASLILAVPDTAFAGPYTGDLTITYLETGP
jgi:hypothetical protein